MIKSEGFIALDWLGRPVRRRSGAGGLVVLVVLVVVLLVVVVVLHDVPDVVDGVDFVFVLGGGMKNLVVVDVVGWWVGCFLFVLGGAVVLLGRVWGGAGGGFVVALEEEEEEEEEEDEEALNWCRALLVSLGAAESRLGFTEATGTFLNGARAEDPRAAEEEPPLSPLDDFLISPRPLFVRCLFLADDLAANSRFRWFRS